MTKPKITLAVDVRGWALENNALQLQRRLSDEFDVSIIAWGEPAERCDVLVAMWWRGLWDFVQRCTPEKVIVGFNGIAEWAPSSSYGSPPSEMLDRAVKRADAMYALNHESALALGRHCGRNSVFVCSDGVDLDMFPLLPLPETFTVGWNGNVDHGPTKGVEIIREACQLAGVPFVMRTRPKTVEPHANVLDFYKQISVYACASESEGTPLPVLEALACGRPVISTAVGIVPELYCDIGDEIFAVARTVESFTLAIKYAYRERLRVSLRDVVPGCRALAATRSWDITVESWRNMIRSIL
jgi:hypothetical protein